MTEGASITIALPVIVQLASQGLPQAEKMLFDMTSKCVHIYENVGTPSTSYIAYMIRLYVDRAFSSLDDARTSSGSFTSVALPKRLTKELLEQQLLLSQAVSNVGGRLSQGGLLAALSSGAVVPSDNVNCLC